MEKGSYTLIKDVRILPLLIGRLAGSSGKWEEAVIKCPHRAAIMVAKSSPGHHFLTDNRQSSKPQTSKRK
ncbi:UNVERIFIED_CONTAM: hypothetical protein Slati_4278000 [Sesamum latifolium]|uniref:Uncharacterized protein n=1 Tax=Sesamum latifolium TaxID=2727402 RepID=A0AAW2TG13_9LAMI